MTVPVEEASQLTESIPSVPSTEETLVEPTMEAKPVVQANTMKVDVAPAGGFYSRESFYLARGLLRVVINVLALFHSK